MESAERLRWKMHAAEGTDRSEIGVPELYKRQGVRL